MAILREILLKMGWELSSAGPLRPSDPGDQLSIFSVIIFKIQYLVGCVLGSRRIGCGAFCAGSYKHFPGISGAFSKQIQFKSEREFRILFETRNSGNESFILNIGSIRDIATKTTIDEINRSIACSFKITKPPKLGSLI